MPILPDPPIANTSGFDQAAVNNLVSNIVSLCQQTGLFRSVNSHEPKSAPGNGTRCSIWANDILPLGGASGLAVTSGEVILNIRIYGNMLQKPEDEIDPRIMTAATTVIAALSADFTLGDTVRNIDLLGAYGPKLSAKAGYLTIGQTVFRIMTITVPVVINDMWEQIS
jgi:hypothetical protein